MSCNLDANERLTARSNYATTSARKTMGKNAFQLVSYHASLRSYKRVLFTLQPVSTDAEEGAVSIYKVATLAVKDIGLDIKMSHRSSKGSSSDRISMPLNVSLVILQLRESAVHT
jgi:hypothetical protein